MPIEAATYINELVSTNPLGSDDRSTADDHIRLVKSALGNSFPNFTGIPMTKTEAELNAGGGGLIISAPITLGTATAYTATVGIVAYVIGTSYKVRIHLENSGGATIALDGLVVTTILFTTGYPLHIGAMQLNHVVTLYYDGTNFILENPRPYISTYVPAITYSFGSATYTAGFNLLHYILDMDLCFIKGGILYSSVSGLGGLITLTLPKNQLSLGGLASGHSLVGATNLSTLPGQPFLGRAFNALYSVYKTGASGTASGAANFITATTALSFEFSYRI